MAEPKVSAANVVSKTVWAEIKYDPEIENGAPLPSGHLSIVIVGASGCGKSTVLLNILPKITELKHVVVLSRIIGNPVYNAIKAGCDARGVKYTFFSDPVEATDGMTKLIEKKPREEVGVCILDDFSSYKAGRDDPYNNIANTVSGQLRNYGWSNIFITQSYTNVQTLTRCNINVRIFFNMAETNARRKLRLDVVESEIISPETFDKVYNILQSLKHSYLMLVTMSKNAGAYLHLGDKDPEELIPLTDDNDEPALNETVAKDAALKAKIERYKKAIGSKSPQLATMALRDLQLYAKNLCRAHKCDEMDFAAIVSEVYGVQI